MRLSSEVANLSIELKARYARITALDDPPSVRKANHLVAALYALSCGSVVVALNAISGKGWRKVMIDKRTVRVLAENLSGNSMLDKMLYNIEQFTTVTSVIKDPRTMAMMNRYLAEWYDVVDAANLRMYTMAKTKAG